MIVSEFLVTLLRIAYLAVLWIFILLVTNVIRTDIYGHRVPRNAEAAADCTLPIDDDYASTRHAEFSPGIDGAWFVEDLASTNGTHVNGERIENPTRLSVGDEVRIGRTVMTVTGGR